jgi:AcrR family transcriptional regulator
MARAGLDPSAVVRAAAEIIDSEGLDALSLSALATKLGVKSPSLYAHIDGLEDLRRRLAVLAAEQLGDAIAPAAAGLARGEALQAVGQAYRSWVLAHPGLYSALEPNGPQGEPAVERVLSLVLAVLRGYGLEDDTAIHAARSLRAALHGFTALETSGGFGIPVDPDISFAWMLDALDRGLSAAGRVAGNDASPGSLRP